MSDYDNMGVFVNGSKWFRADFHLHTIKDKEFEKITNPNDFVNLFVDKLTSEHVSVGLITNHNKFDKDEYKALKKKAKKTSIWLLPGVELSVNDGANGIHCLVAFDGEAWLKDNEDYINQFLTAAFEGVANRENENTRCKYNIITLLNKLEDHRKQGRDSFIIMAHVEQNSGFLKELDGGRIQQIVASELFQETVLGLQKIRTYGDITKYRQWFNGNLPAFVEGSDCKTLNDVGKASLQNNERKKTYVKLGDFNFEALKYALIDHVHRVSSEPPCVLNSYVKSIQFIGGKLNGKLIPFSSELNCLIGIRGSGKSSILEILRYALGIQLSRSSVDKEYKTNLITYILGSGGKVIVNVVSKDGKEYRIEKIYGQKEIIFDKAGIVQDCSVSAIFDLPIYFGQKDLSDKEEDFESDLLNRLSGSRLIDIQRKIENKKRDVRNSILELKKGVDLEEQKKDVQIAVKDAEKKLLVYKEKGIEEKLKVQVQFEQDVNSLKKIQGQFLSYASDIKELLNKYDSFFNAIVTPSADVNELIFENVNAYIGNARRYFTRLKEINENNSKIQRDFESAVARMEQKRAEMVEDFASIKREINSDVLNPDMFLDLNRYVNVSKIKLEEIERQVQKRETRKTKLLEELIALNELWLDEFRVLEQEADKINKSNSNLNIIVNFKGLKSDFLGKMKEVFKGTGIRDSVYQGLVSEFPDFIEIYRNHEKAEEILGNNINTFEKRFIENAEELLTYKVKNEVTINYKSKPLRNHSLGQRASALILFLLAQKENDCLIIDQPEDDLDNQTIYEEVIKEIMVTKGQMQFIFATHNANIPVLGDSERIITCAFEDPSEITLNIGTIDTPSIQKSIVDIMEGGKEAFNKRKSIYNIWK